jgi:hypothetical protein
MFGHASRYTLMRGAAAIQCCILFVLGFCFSLAADEFNKKTVVTFSAPVELPGKVLPPGTYVFRILDTASDRHIVQVFDKDEKHLYATVVGIPDYRMTTPEKPVISFEERPSNTPEALKEWFYPGDNYGVQFVYPQDRAKAIAKRTNQNVLAMRNEMSNNISAPSKSASDSSVQELKKTDVTAVDPSGQKTDVSTVAAPKPK